MKIVRYTSYGDPSEVAEVVEVDALTPGAHEVIVTVEAAPIHLADLYNLRGDAHFRSPLPATPGYEGVGNIKSVGTGVEGWAAGDRVLLPMAAWSWCEECRVLADELRAAPAGDAAQLSLLPINPPTSYLMLDDFGELQPGDWIIQNAANSSCGRYLITLAQLRGINTVNVVRRESLIPELQQLGGDVVLTDGDDLAARVKAASENALIRLGIDAIAGRATARIGECVNDGSTILIYGGASGEDCKITPHDLFLRDLRVVGFWTIRQLYKRSAEQQQAIYDELGEIISNGQLSTRIAATYPLTEVKQAVSHAGRVGAEREGKIILLPNA